jgi:hypothetical protein
VRVYKFLEARHAQSNIANRHIKISRIGDLNDPFELRPINVSHRPQLRRVLDAWRKEMDKDHGVLCFSRTWQDPVLWSHYGDKHRGVCLGYELDPSLAEPVRYRVKRISPRFDKKKMLVRDDRFVQDMLFTKFKRWDYEDEVRVWSSLDHGTVDGRGHYFYTCNDKLSLREVIFGPLCDADVDEFARSAARSGGQVQARRPRLAFSKFCVVALPRGGRLMRVHRLE